MMHYFCSIILLNTSHFFRRCYYVVIAKKMEPIFWKITSLYLNLAFPISR